MLRVIKQAKDFFKGLSNYLVCNRHLILGGDFNCILNPQYDKIGKSTNPHACLLYEFQRFDITISITDIFRHLNPFKFATTWHAPVSRDIHTRLDGFYVSKSLISDNVTFLLAHLSRRLTGELIG